MKNKNMILRLALCLVFLLIHSVLSAHPINELPMYGGVEKTPEQKKLDDEFIKTVTQQNGTREKASENVANLGWKYLRKGDQKTAMKRFNQAWLLNSKNPHAF
ncbi:hypothetical protein KJ966_12545 [bacterium]|nr:hypothetical protein [bacterium]